MKMETKNVLDKLGRLARFFSSPRARAVLKVSVAVISVIAAVDELRSARRRPCEDDCDD